MPDRAAGTQFTVLTPADQVDEDRIADFYSYPDGPRTCWVRGNMIASLDGGATADGKSGGLGGSGDRALFTLMRDAADVILVGAATVRVEDYSGAQLSVTQREARRRRGQGEVPPIAVVTRSAELDPDTKLFTRTAVPPLILTCTRTVAAARRRLGAVAEVIDASGADDTDVDPARALTILAERKLVRVLTEGGPSLLGLLIQDNLLDELCLTLAPAMVGGVVRRVASGPGLVHTRMRRSHVLTDDEGYLYTRYVRNG
jgi:riboflavin biosynthesis pyrimidine reductase